MTLQPDPVGSAISISNVDVSNSAIAIGANARASNRTGLAGHPECQAALDQLREQLLELRARDEAVAAKVDTALGHVDELDEELGRRNPKPAKILSRLGALAAGMDGLARVGDALTHLLKAVGSAFGG
jgi:hypothetical protein